MGAIIGVGDAGTFSLDDSVWVVDVIVSELYEVTLVCAEVLL